MRDADLIFSTVTADQAVTVAREASSFMRDKSYFFDLNSSAPSSKQRSCKVLRHMEGVTWTSQ